jgi:EspA/EspE family
MGLLGKLESFGKAVWDTGNEVVDVIGDVGAVVEGVGAIAGFIERVGKSAHLDDVIEVGERLGGWAERVGLNKFLRAADSPILDGGQVVIAGMKLTMGIGEPENGERFGRGGARCHDAGTTLRSAQPSASWSGEGADSYAVQNVQQTARTKAIAAVDHEVHRVIAEEAFQVGFHRDHLDDWSNFLTDFGLVTFAMGLIPGVGQELKAAAELQAVLAAVISSSTELYQMSSEAEANAAKLQQLTARYQNVAQTANLSPTGVDPGPPPPPPPPHPSAPPEQSPTDGPRDQQPGNGPATYPTPTASSPAPMPAPSGLVRSAPSMPAAGGSSSGGGAGSPMSGARPAAPSVDMAASPEVPTRTVSGSPGAPPAAGALPGVTGGMPPSPMGAGAAPPAASGAPVALIKEAVQAAMQREAEKQAEARKSDGEEDAKDKDEDGKPDAEKGLEKGLEKDKDGDGKPDADHEEKVEADEKDQPAAAAGGVDGGRAPVHIEMDIDTEQLLTPMTVTLDSYW